MIDETKKSIQSILNQRITSPFYGTFMITWCIWNWKILYLTFFVSEKKLATHKIEYIVSNYSDYLVLLLYPFLSTILILTLFPFLTNAAYWLELKFDKWRIEKKNEIEKKQLLTVEQSIGLREQIINMENRFEALLSNKNAEIQQLKLLITDLEKDSTPTEIKPDVETRYQQEIEELANKILTIEKLKSAHLTIKHYVQGGFIRLAEADNIDPQILDFFDSNGLIEKTEKNTYTWTPKGKAVNRIINNKEFN